MAIYQMKKEELIEEEMAPNAIKAFLKLQSLGCPVKTWSYGDRGHFWIDAEEPEAEGWLDYYGNYSGSEVLNDILKQNGLWFEWQNSAVACVFNF